MYRYPEPQSQFLNDYNSNYKNKTALNYTPSIIYSSNSNSFFDYYGNIESMANPNSDDLGKTTENDTEMDNETPDKDISENESPDTETPSNGTDDTLDNKDPKNDSPISDDLIDSDKPEGVPVPESTNDCIFNGKKTTEGQCYPINLGDNIPCNGLILPSKELDKELPSTASIQDTIDNANKLGEECKNNPKKMGCWYVKGTEINDKMVSSKLDSKAMWCPGDYGHNDDDIPDADASKVYVQDSLDWTQFHKGCNLSNNFKIDMNTLQEKNKILNQSIEDYNNYKTQALNEAKASNVNQNKAILIKNSDTGELLWLNAQGNLQSLPKGKTIKDIEACNQGQTGFIQELKTNEEIKALGPVDVNASMLDICTADGVSVPTTQGMLNAQQRVETTANDLQSHLNCMLQQDYNETAEIKQKKHVITQYLNRIRLEREVFQKNRDILEKGRAQSAQDKIAYVSNYYWMIIWGLIVLYIMYRIVK